MKHKIFISIFSVWIILWAFFNIRELFIKGNINDYNILLHRATLDDKRAYVTGDRLYEFIRFCNDKLPPKATYRWVEADKGDHSRRRFTYYLYPHLEMNDARFILVYDNRDVPKNGYEIFAALDDNRYILKKVER